MESRRNLYFVAIFVSIILGGLLASSILASAQTRLEMRPNLQPLPASNISLAGGVLSFSTTSWNNGNGPLELIAGQVDSRAKKQKVYQRIYYNDGTYYDRLAGDFVWHKLHNHFHFEQYALYTLQPVDAPGASSRTSQKTTFCVMDTAPVDLNIAGAPGSAIYSTCNNVKQGMSVGWADTYGSFLAGQSLSVSGLPDGRYNLIIEIDPQARLLEVSDGDNVSCVVLDLSISTNQFTVVDSTGCSAAPPPLPPPPPAPITITGIGPSVVQAGSVNSVLITGSGFASGMSVTFENGSGQAPVASSVNVLDANNLTALVVVKKGGNKSDPVWDLRVGTALLADALRVE